jgi:transcriptional regulator with XRE-family HTH domain
MFSLQQIADAMEVEIEYYLEIEQGLSHLSLDEALDLGKLFGINGEYFYEAANQLEDLQACKLHIRLLRQENLRLKKIQGLIKIIETEEINPVT